ncbi:MAG: aldehyde dehydrogenase, partial [Rikenellaceae bacterium]|nr:aldehyde dehydrogenase [Rikenellaceae bacterium]
MADRFWIDVFVQLGRRLESFGRDECSRHVITQALVDNPWFTEHDILFAVNAIREQMLNEGKLSRWIANYGEAGDRSLPFPSPRPASSGCTLGIIMAGNIPLVGFADLLYGLICGYECHVKTSSKDTALMSYMIDLIEDISDDIHVGRTINATPDALIATGSDETVRTLRGLYPGGRALFRGTRLSIAVLSGNETDVELRLLADDIFTYCGLGCRNVSLLFVPEGFDMQHAAGVFKTYEPVRPAYRNNYLQNRAVGMMESPQGVVDGGFFTLVPCNYFPLYISIINYITYTNLEQIDS